MTHKIERRFHRGRLVAIEAFTGSAKNVSRGKMASVETIRQIVGLRTFSNARRP